MADFEVLMVSIDWESLDKIRTVIPAKRNLEASKITGKNYEYDIVLYHKEDGLYFQFAIISKFTPYLKSNDNTWNQLYNVKDDLWINKGEWKIGAKGVGYHHCHSINTIGKIELGFRDAQRNPYFISIDVNNNIDDFDFEQLKDDFEGELWNLITSKKSNVTADKVELRYGNRAIRFPENKVIVDFINAFDQISKNPKRELSASSENRKTEKVIPIADTYRKISISGMSKILPSKAVLENYDIYENRAICIMLHNIHLIVYRNIKYTSQQIERLKKEILIHNQKITILLDPDPKVNPEKIIDEILAQEEFLKNWKNKWENRKTIFVDSFNNTAESFNELVFQISGVRYYGGKPTFWGNKINGNDAGWSALEFQIDPDGLFEDGKDITVKFFAAYKRQEIIVGENKRYKFSICAIQKNRFEYISSYQDNIIQKQRENHTTLQKNNWRQFSILSDTDINKFIKERDNQVKTLSNKIEKINSQIKNIIEFSEEQSNLHPLLLQRLKSDFFSKIKWKSFHGFKPSMTFIQNINYRNTLRYYNAILNSEGIEIDVFDLYENISSYGLREMPLVYELWCLITQIKVLEDRFHFAHEKNDLKSLLKILNPKKEKFEDYLKFNFKNKLQGREVTLHYQKILENGKRPDFILEISCGNRKINLILDSKFKNYNYKQSIIYDSIAMKDKYGKSDDNYVFVLHPCKDGVFENRNIKYTNLGGEKIYYNNGIEIIEEFPFHKFGFIELKPYKTDSLVKLIGMGLEYLIESNKNAKKDKLTDPVPEFPPFCLNCAESDLSENKYTYLTGGKYYKYICNTAECNHEINISYCWACQSKLFKHGTSWDYHLESTYNVTDIRCPNCGMTMADRPK